MIYAHTHTHRSTTGTRHGACTIACLQPDSLGMPETNPGHHTVPVGLIIACIRSPFVL